jgi:hypothetical protein
MRIDTARTDNLDDLADEMRREALKINKWEDRLSLLCLGVLLGAFIVALAVSGH